MISSLRLAPVLLLLSGAALRVASAEPLPPQCGPAFRGAQTCMAGDTCTCDWYRGGSITAEPTGWRWNCSIQRMCGAPAPADDGSPTLPPGTLISPQIGLPSMNQPRAIPEYP